VLETAGLLHWHSQTQVGYQSNLQSPARKIAVISAPLSTQRGLIQHVGSTLTVTGIGLNTGRCVDSFGDHRASQESDSEHRAQKDI